MASSLPRNAVPKPLPNNRLFSIPRRLLCFTLTIAGLASLQGAEPLVSPVPPSGRVSNGPVATRFSIQSQNGIPWLVDPQGHPFFYLGVSCVDQGTRPDQFDSSNPSYAASRYYAGSNQWAEATTRRLRSWGFNTIGAWSDFATFRRSGTDLKFAPVLHVGSTAGAPWWDMWDPKIIDRMHQIARDKILPLQHDPRVIGYYSDNEMGWWNATLFKMTLEQAPTSGQRRRLLRLLRETYHDQWEELLADFEPEGTSSWEELEQTGMLYLRPGGRGIQTMRKFLGLLAERYYSLVREIIHKYDPGALVLGDRYQSFYYPEVARAAGPYLDAISSNLNANWSDGTFARFYLQTLHDLSGKPIIVSEFYMSAAENRSGNRNNRGVFPVVATQKARADGVRTTLQALAKNPWVLGADWFQYYDEPTHGRADGENYNFGLVDIADQPYDGLTRIFSETQPAKIKSQSLAHPSAPDAGQGVPRAPADPFAHLEPTLGLKHWDRARGFVKPTSKFPVADLYLCWNKQAIYLGLYAQDIVEEAFYRSKFVPKNDRAQWLVRLPGSGRSVQARIGSGAEPIVDDPAVRIANLSGLNLNVRNIAIMELPASLFGKKRFRTGDKIQVGSTLFTHCQGYQMDWSGEFVLR